MPTATLPLVQPAGQPGARNNYLLAAVAARCPESFKQLELLLKPVAVAAGTVVINGGDPPRGVLFVDSGLVSVVPHTPSGESLEVGFVAREGVTCASWMLGSMPPSYSFVVSLPVTGRWLDGADARRLLAAPEPNALHDAISTYGQFLIEQLVQAVICARYHSASQRVARLLLLMADRLGDDVIPRTHESLAPMVGVPRSAVTESLAALRRWGAIDASRGQVAVHDREKLRAQACECAETDSARFEGFVRRLRG